MVEGNPVIRSIDYIVNKLNISVEEIKKFADFYKNHSRSLVINNSDLFNKILQSSNTELQRIDNNRFYRFVVPQGFTDNSNFCWVVSLNEDLIDEFEIKYGGIYN
jgi:hypothetical protein